MKSGVPGSGVTQPWTHVAVLTPLVGGGVAGVAGGVGDTVGGPGLTGAGAGVGAVAEPAAPPPSHPESAATATITRHHGRTNLRKRAFPHGWGTG